MRLQSLNLVIWLRARKDILIGRKVVKKPKIHISICLNLAAKPQEAKRSTSEQFKDGSYDDCQLKRMASFL